MRRKSLQEGPLTDLPIELDHTVIAGYWPIGSELDVRPLLHALCAGGRDICLPVVTRKDAPLSFRRWRPDCVMAPDAQGVPAPLAGEVMRPTLILVPLLAFTPNGARLGYGGGYYDRTLAALRSSGDVFACGVAYAGQEVRALPTDAHDAPLNGILTPDGFRTFT